MGPTPLPVPRGFVIPSAPSDDRQPWRYTDPLKSSLVSKAVLLHPKYPGRDSPAHAKLYTNLVILFRLLYFYQGFAPAPTTELWWETVQEDCGLALGKTPKVQWIVDFYRDARIRAGDEGALGKTTLLTRLVDDYIVREKASATTPFDDDRGKTGYVDKKTRACWQKTLARNMEVILAENELLDACSVKALSGTRAELSPERAQLPRRPEYPERSERPRQSAAEQEKASIRRESEDLARQYMSKTRQDEQPVGHDRAPRDSRVNTRDSLGQPQATSERGPETAAPSSNGTVSIGQAPGSKRPRDDGEEAAVKRVRTNSIIPSQPARENGDRQIKREDSGERSAYLRETHERLLQQQRELSHRLQDETNGNVPKYQADDAQPQQPTEYRDESALSSEDMILLLRQRVDSLEERLDDETKWSRAMGVFLYEANSKTLKTLNDLFTGLRDVSQGLAARLPPQAIASRGPQHATASRVSQQSIATQAPQQPVDNTHDEAVQASNVGGANSADAQGGNRGIVPTPPAGPRAAAASVDGKADSGENDMTGLEDGELMSSQPKDGSTRPLPEVNGLDRPYLRRDVDDPERVSIQDDDALPRKSNSSDDDTQAYINSTLVNGLQYAMSHE